jgi:hypothetical protein
MTTIAARATFTPDAISAAINAVSLPAGAAPVLLTLTVAPDGTLTARAEPVAADVWKHGVETVLRGFAVGLRRTAGWGYEGIVGYALAKRDDAAVYTVDVDGGWHITPMTDEQRAPMYDAARWAPVWWGLSAMIAAITGRPEPTGFPANGSPTSAPLFIGRTGRLCTAIRALAADAGTGLDTVTSARAARQAWRTAPFVLVAASAVASLSRARLPHRPGVIVVADESADPTTLFAAADRVRADYACTLPMAAPWLADRFTSIARPDDES